MIWCNVFVKLRWVSSEEIGPTTYKVTLPCTIYLDEAKENVLCEKIFTYENIALDLMRPILPQVYPQLMQEFTNPTFE